MPDNKQDATSSDGFDELISRVYDVALDAARYGELLDSWEQFSHANKQSEEKNANPLIANHFERAVTVLDQLADFFPGDDFSDLLGQFENVATIVIGRGNEILGANEAALQNLEISPRSTIDALSIEPEDKSALSSQISKMLSDESAGISIFRVRTKKSGTFLILQMRRTVSRSGLPVIVAATSDIRWPDGFKSVLKEAFNLSGAETEVVRLLIECCSVKEIAEQRGRSIDTVRAQIKAIFSKTETRSQIELVRLTLSMMDIAANTTDFETVPRLTSRGTDQLESLSYHTIHTEDNRRLDYLVLGDPNGRPALFITCEYGYARWTASAEKEAKKRGIKIISPIRAGYGESHRLPKGVPFCQSIAEDLLTVLDAENAKNVPVISLSDDHHFATQAEKIRPGTMCALIATAGGLPFLSNAQVQRLDKWYRFIQGSARYTPHLLPYMVKMGWHLAMKQGRKVFWETIYADSPADMATLNDPEVQEALTVGSNPATAGTYDGTDTFTRQTIFEQEAWLVDHVHWLKDRMPVHFLLGLEDPGMPKETIEEHQIEFDWIDFRIYEDTGQLLLFKHWRDVLDLVEEHL